MEKTVLSCCTRLKKGIVPKPSWKRKLSMYDSYDDSKIRKMTSQKSEYGNKKHSKLSDNIHEKDLANKMKLKACYVKLEKIENSEQFNENKKLALCNDARKQKCCVEGCINIENVETSSNCDLFRFPDDEELKANWSKILDVKWVPDLLVCSNHFVKSDIIYKQIPDRNGTTKLLRIGALPKKLVAKKIDALKSETINNLIDSLFEKNLVDKETYELLTPFKDIKYSVFDHKDEADEEYEKVYELSNLLYSQSEVAYKYLKSIIPLPNIALSPTEMKSSLSSSSLLKLLNEMFPSVTNVDVIKSSLCLTDLLIEANLILKGTRFLVEKHANFLLSTLLNVDHEKKFNSEIISFCRIILLNSPQAFICLSKCFPLPDIKQLFVTIGPDVPMTITLGQMILEASSLGVIGQNVVKELSKYNDCQLTPFTSSTVNDNGQAISCIYFNSLPLFNYLVQYLPLPNIVLVSKFTPTKSNDNARSPPAIKHVVIPKSTSDLAEVDSVDEQIQHKNKDHGDEFFMGLCPKTGKNIMKMQVDMEGFLPKELTVKVVGNTMTISGCKEDEKQKVEFLRKIILPPCVDADQAGCYYFKGCMAVHAPICNLEAAQQFITWKSEKNINFQKQSFITITRKIVEETPSKTDHETLSNQIKTTLENSQLDKVASKKTNISFKTSLTPKNAVNSNIPYNVAVLVNVEGQEYISLVVEVSKLFKPNEIVVKVRENKVVSVTGETRSTDEIGKSRLYAFIEREFDLPKKVDRKTLKAGCTGDGLLKIFARVAI